MKVSQIVLGECYESKNGREIREVISFVSDGTINYVEVPVVATASEARKLTRLQFTQLHRRIYNSSRKDFAKWAARKQGTSTHRSVDGRKFLNLIQGPTA